MNETITWSTPEYEHKERSADWYIALGIITISASVAAFLLGNILFGFFILIGAFTLAMYSMRTPEEMFVEINNHGIVINDRIYTYNSLESFWVEGYDTEPKIIIQSEKTLMPYIVIPLGGVDPEEVREYLLEHLEEEEHSEPLSHKIMEYLGF